MERSRRHGGAGGASRQRRGGGGAPHTHKITINSSRSLSAAARLQTDISKSSAATETGEFWNTLPGQTADSTYRTGMVLLTY